MNRTIEEALRYKATAALAPHLADPNGAAHQIFIDALEDEGHSELAQRVSEERDRGPRPAPPSPDSFSETEYILTQLAHRHPSPAIRALAAHSFGEKRPSPHLLTALLNSHNHFDQDAGVTLSPAVPLRSEHPAHPTYKTLRSSLYSLVGLEPKVVGDSMYLTHSHRIEDGHYGAPSILYQSKLNDAADLKGMVAHAQQVRQQMLAAENWGQ